MSLFRASNEKSARSRIYISRTDVSIDSQSKADREKEEQNRRAGKGLRRQNKSAVRDSNPVN